MNRGPSEDRGRTTTFKKKGMQRTTRAESSGTCKMILYNVRIDLNYLSLVSVPGPQAGHGSLRSLQVRLHATLAPRRGIGVEAGSGGASSGSCNLQVRRSDG